ncbi:hypothetical protein [Mangrovibacterium sp.]|uniref:hypothetical protein n=1 Tax=Mangrovibacterium sp. TaxID=1961364 RepID=UPI003561BE92
MGKIKEHHHDEIECGNREKNTYLRFGKHEFFAIHHAENIVYSTCTEPDNLWVKKFDAPKDYVEDYLMCIKTGKDISEELFQEKFSEVISKLHNETPYA